MSFNFVFAGNHFKCNSNYLHPHAALFCIIFVIILKPFHFFFPNGIRIKYPWMFYYKVTIKIWNVKLHILVRSNYRSSLSMLIVNSTSWKLHFQFCLICSHAVLILTIQFKISCLDSSSDINFCTWICIFILLINLKSCLYWHSSIVPTNVFCSTTF